MKLSRRKVAELKTVSVSHGVLQYYGHTWVDDQPEEWGRNEQQLYDMLSEVENRMISAFLEILGAAESVEVGEQPTTELSRSEEHAQGGTSA